jgi:hypothetical protein
VNSARKDADALRRRLRKLGYSTPPRGGHYAVLRADGRPLIDPTGRPVTLAGTPNSRALTNTRAWLRRSGVPL